jgi:hypothetical protein
MAMQMMEYGIKCNKDDEKQIVKNINNFLQKEYNYRKMYKRKDESISKFNYGDYYCQFIKEKPLWYFDIFPNEDLDGKWKFDNKEIQWVLFLSKNDVEEYTQKNHEEVDLFFKKLMDAIGFKIILLHDYKHDEERIGNIEYDDDGNEI